MKVLISDIFDIFLSKTRMNRSKIYKEFIIQSSTSQLIRGKSHNQKNIFENSKRLRKYFLLFIRIFLFNLPSFFKKDLNKKSINQLDLLIIYPDNDKWILRGLSKDLVKEINLSGFKSRSCQYREIKNYFSKHILFIHHDLAIRAIKKYPNYSLISSTYISHIRTLTLTQLELLNNFQYIFCQSSKDKMRLNALGAIPGRVIHLPIGYDDKVFLNYKTFREREFDFVISTPLRIRSLGSHYWLRKSTLILSETLSMLANLGFKILIIGESWDQSPLNLQNNITVKTPNYRDKNKWLNDCKIFLNLSLMEGGPVTIIEALASGCKVLSKDNGNAFEISKDIPDNFFTIKNFSSPSELSQRIIKIYDENKINGFPNIEDYLRNNYSFNALAKIIISKVRK